MCNYSKLKTNPPPFESLLNFLNYKAELVELFRSIRLKCKTHFLASEDKKCKCKMNWAAVKPLTGTEVLSVITTEDFGTRIIVKYLCMSVAAVLDKEKIHNLCYNRFGSRQTFF